MKKVLCGIFGTVLAVAICVGIAFGTGWLNVGYTKTVGKAQTNAENQVFHQTQAYIDGAVSDISKVKLEYEQAKDKDTKQALLSYIRSTYANLNPADINNPSVAEWLRDVQNGNFN
ncbi:MAG TPA: hypothetical protein VHO71_04535 [Caproiciproducens sp.]|nr:hypothetical protein [Caproiciproducens sp.]